MGWKNWPYWVKGVVIGLLLTLISFYIGSLLGVTGGLLGIIALLLWMYGVKTNLVLPKVLIISLPYIILPIVGAIIGLIYGKIKKKKEMKKGVN